jgi:hypothetical protein
MTLEVGLWEMSKFERGHVCGASMLELVMPGVLLNGRPLAWHNGLCALIRGWKYSSSLPAVWNAQT